MEQNLESAIQSLIETHVPALASARVAKVVVSRAADYAAMIAIELPDRNPAAPAQLEQSDELVSAICERVDVDEVSFVAWDSDPATFVRNAFAPVPVVRVVFDADLPDGGKVVQVVVRDDDLDEAIGIEGDRPRLAALLTGHDLEIVTESESA